MSNKNKTIELQRIITVKVIVTEEYKSKLINDTNSMINSIESLQNNLVIELKNNIQELTSKGNISGIDVIRRQVDAKNFELLEQMRVLYNNLKVAEGLVLGSEYTPPISTLEGKVTVQVGDNLYKKLGAAELLVKDGIIIEIRNVE